MVAIIRLAIFILLTGMAWAARLQQADVNAIIRQSVAANEADWNAANDYDYIEQDRDVSGAKTYHVFMIDGSPYQELVAVGGKPLSSADQQQEQQKLHAVMAKRRSESANDRAGRLAKYQKERKRDHILMQQLVQAFKFRLQGKRRLGGYNVYVLQATPRPGYRPPNLDSQVLTGMRGTLWIDERTYQWVKVEAYVVRPVSIAGFVARVQPGTRFELEKMPVGNGIWLTKQFAMKSNSRILLLFPHRNHEDETFSNYQKSASTAP